MGSSLGESAGFNFGSHSFVTGKLSILQERVETEHCLFVGIAASSPAAPGPQVFWNYKLIIAIRVETVEYFFREFFW